ncbi:hypothetical protein V1509DRAFT_628767 [Lipomyces kononenkoae]
MYSPLLASCILFGSCALHSFGGKTRTNESIQNLKPAWSVRIILVLYNPNTAESEVMRVSIFGLALNAPRKVLAYFITH